MNRADRRRQEKQARKRARQGGGGKAVEARSPAGASALTAAVQHHGAGRLEDAEAGYRQVLAENPNQPAALHLLGVVAYQRGQGAAAVELIEKALAQKPDFFEAMNNLGAAYRQLGRTVDAIASYRNAIAVKPDYVDAHFNLANALQAEGDLADAVAAYRRAVEISPAHVDAHLNLGNALKAMGEQEAARSSYIRAIECRPESAEAENNLGSLLVEMAKPVEGEAHFRRALELDPRFAKAESNLGNALHALGRLDDAAGCYRRALEIEPGAAEAHYNLGNVLKELGQWEEARASLLRAIELRPEYTDAHVNLANLLVEMRHLDEAAAVYAAAIASDPVSAEAHTNLGLLQLLRGDFAAGWANYAWRWKRPAGVVKPRQYAAPPWAGEALAGRRIFVYPEQGYGDTLQFARYLPILAELGAAVAFEVPTPLRRLFAAGAAPVTLVEEGAAPPDFDCHAALLELPRLLVTTAETIPPPGDVLAVPAELVAPWAERIGTGDGLRVGIAWAGRPTHVNDAKRSIAAALLAPLAAVAGVRLYSLQLGQEGAAEAVFGGRITDLAPHLADFADTAAAIRALDLVISVDTSVVHLAGALGRTVWTLLAHTPDWRWQFDRADSPWYPSMRLFRQDRAGDWRGVIARVGAAFGEMAGGG